MIPLPRFQLFSKLRITDYIDCIRFSRDSRMCSLDENVTARFYSPQVLIFCLE